MTTTTGQFCVLCKRIGGARRHLLIPSQLRAT
jgi:hypothetical protein